MKKTKHTPGPWTKSRDFKLDPDKFGLGVQQRVSVIEADPNFKIADVFDTAFPDMNEANARLIAAAPEMLEALEEALSIMRANTTSRYMTEEMQQQFAPAMNACRDAIRKAKGEL